MVKGRGAAAGLVAVGGCVLLAGGCAGGGGTAGASGPRRPAVAVEDAVGAVDRAALVGSWSCRELNPFEGRQPQAQTLEFREDGKGRSSATIDMAAQGGPLPGRMAVDHTFDWTVEGERVAVGNTQATVRAADGNAATGALAGLTQFVINRFSSETKPGTMDVLRLDGERLVVRTNTEVELAPTLDCTRA
jgi:hypothetical protein